MRENIKIFGQEIEYQKVYRPVKYPRLEFKSNNLVVILPRGYRKEKELLIRHQKWISQKRAFITRVLKKSAGLHLDLSADLSEFKEKSSCIIEEYAEELQVSIGKITFRKMKSKWGSCRGDGHITVNSLLRFLPEKLVRYILFHEVLHRMERRHNQKFYGMVKSKFGDIKATEENLLAYYFLLEKHFFRGNVHG
ncbi:MAG: M48 family metallopeptidase [Caldiserica bacterium]|nr:M48 family metallopeptidase [Caldisericota bacterium]